MTDESAPPPDLDRQIRALTEIVGMLAAKVMRAGRDAPNLDQQNEEDPWRPAEWVWSAPALDETADPETTVESFVAFYNRTYVGLDGGKAKPIPPCWRQHPGLAMEVATLAYTWLTANIGPTANVRDAQNWHHQWRPVFADRLTRDWAHADCLDGHHCPTVDR